MADLRRVDVPVTAEWGADPKPDLNARLRTTTRVTVPGDGRAHRVVSGWHTACGKAAYVTKPAKAGAYLCVQCEDEVQ